jgi:hypothetical protein
MYFSFLIWIHILIWIFVLFGGFINKKYALINIQYVIPFIYLVHLLPYHLIVKEKIKYIEKNLDKWNDIDLANTLVDESDVLFIKQYTQPTRTPETSDTKVAKILKYEEDNILIVKIKNIINNKLFKNSFQPPLSPQGMLILGFILNFNIYKWRT